MDKKATQKIDISLAFLCTLFVIGLVTSCRLSAEKNEEDQIEVETTLSPLELKYQEAKLLYENEPEQPENLIWYGRRTAYLGNYEEAIDLYTKGVVKFPEDPRFLRHRGHRYISTRQFDKAIADLSEAGKMIQGTENTVEPDGLPNARNIPVSSLHGNIWYHLGLAYYLKHDYKNAYEAYLKCRESGSHPDNIASSTHWLYMIQRRLENEEKAKELLEPIKPGADIIENFSYYKLCQFYKGDLPIDSVQGNAGSPSSDAMKYGLGNWHFYNGDRDKARNIWEEILSGKAKSSFGYIAAESDLEKYFAEN
ncbi:MAG: hypothetical protein HKN89_07380 [Eudoraea sp.]|nr:hypothetical protein [Eudoraea sp.]